MVLDKKSNVQDTLVEYRLLKKREYFDLYNYSQYLEKTNIEKTSIDPVIISFIMASHNQEFIKYENLKREIKNELGLRKNYVLSIRVEISPNMKEFSLNIYSSHKIKENFILLIEQNFTQLLNDEEED